MISGTLHFSVPVFLIILIFFNPFPHITSVKEIAFFLSLTATLILAWRKKIRPIIHTPLTYPFLLFVLWAFIGLFFALDRENSIHDFLTHLLKYIILYHLLICFFSTVDHLLCLMWTISLSITLVVFSVLIYYYILLENDWSQRFAFGLTEISTNSIGMLTIFGMMFFLYQLILNHKKKHFVLSCICLFPLTAATFMAQTRGTFIALIIALIILLIKKKKALIIALSAVLFISYVGPIKERLVDITDWSGPRTSQNFISFEILKDFPITGIGYGMETYHTALDLDQYNQKVPEPFRAAKVLVAPHNMVFSIAVRLGFVGLFLFCLIIFHTVKMCHQCIRYGKNEDVEKMGLILAAALAGFGVIGLFEPIFNHMPELYLCTLLSMITVLWRINEGIDHEKPSGGGNLDKSILTESINRQT